MDAIDDADPPAAAPHDLCAAIGTALFERLVPGGIPLTETTYSSGSDAGCDYRTANGGQVGSNSYGSLHVRLLRYGRVGWYSGSDRASHALAESCDGTGASGRFHGVPGLGDESCSAFEDEGADRTGRGSAIVRRGSDLFWVDYYTHPGTGDQAERAVTEVALASLAGIP
ncbi:hypothetical protein AB0I30_13805 [Nocardia tengchongensis]|uniref:hypothetical protein n=1 Tax=Nocardia tengchongensis TaxID=2055889 RepID=UPI0033F9856C